MALAVKIIYSFLDDKGSSATTEIKIPTGFSIAQNIEFVQAMALLVDKITSGKITSANFCVGVDLSALAIAGTPDLQSDVEEKGFFQFTTAADFQTRLQIPALTEGLVVAGSDAINLGNADVLAFKSAMIDGITLADLVTVISPTDEREGDIVSLDFAREHFRASGRRR